jgi:hypothetical protein
MARKTKAELAAEREEAQAMREAHEFAAYPTLLLDTLERATTLNYELTVNESKFVVRDPNSRAKWAMTPQHTKDSQETLEALVYDVEEVEARRAEAEHRYLATQTALAKLTPEERQLLNLV